MLIVNSPMKQADITALLEGYTDGPLRYQLAKKQGMQMFFKVTGGTVEAAIPVAKQIIRSTPWGSVLYFQVTAEA